MVEPRTGVQQFRNKVIMNEKVISFVKSLSVGPCSCRWDAGSATCGTYDTITGKRTYGHYDRGPRTHHCVRCRAREALDADKIEYSKSDSEGWYDFIVKCGAV